MPNPLSALAVRLSLATRVVLGGAVLIAGIAGTLTWEAARRAEASAISALEVRTRGALNLTIARLQALGPIRLEGDKLYAGEQLLNDFHTPLEELERATGEGGTLFLGNTRIATSVKLPDGRRPVGTRFENPAVQQAVLRDGKPMVSIVVIAGIPRLANYMPLRDAQGAVVGMVGHGAILSDIQAQVAADTRRMAAWAAGMGLLGLLLLWLLVRNETRPLGGMAGVLTRLAEGRTDEAVPAQSRRDALGEMARAVVVVQQAVARTKALEAEAEAQRHAAEASRKATLEQSAAAFEGAVLAEVDATAGEGRAMGEVATRLDATAQAAARDAAAVRDAAGQAAANVQSLAAAAEELSASISEIGRQMAKSAETAQLAAGESRRTNDDVAQLSEAASRIGDVVRLIGDIAGQTNLLALNATIEAARAGEAGKGFAVVAGEVKSLAAQTAKATEEIGAQIAAMQGATTGAVEAIRGIAARIEELSGLASSTAAAVEQQRAATAEIAGNVQRVATSTEAVSSRIGSVADAAERAREGAAEAARAAAGIGARAESLRGAVAGSVARIRAA
jgi:methyl-accepting chemotaxis protein